ncbi:MAG: serine/threonine protein phosphatase [Alphaproteobacteria bacterium]|nr:serine/threonine protein phosphatase [Alphaproteobacteria bacterium]MCB9974585.1 serine/threonine protein phosphatase [Rhodospirillales bacterium]
MNNQYSIPEGFRVYAVGDVHGYPDALERMHLLIKRDMESSPDLTYHIVYLGDFIDRGPDSAGVLDQLILLKERNDGIFRSFLLGNHEHAMIRFMNDPYIDETSSWLEWGGVETVQSYGYSFRTFPPVRDDIEDARDYLNSHVPEKHWDFLINMPMAIEIGGYFFSHAGVDPRKSFKSQDIWDLIAIRQPFLSWHEEVDYKPLSKKVVHGHTISKEPVIRPHRIGVDTGLYRGGPLTTAVLEGEDVRFLQVR